MNTSEFEKIRQGMEEYQRNILTSKANEYAIDEDRLWNFKQGAIDQECTPEEVLRHYQGKHSISIKKMMRDLKAGKVAKYEMWIEKLMDINTYNILLLALIKERLNQPASKESATAVQSLNSGG